MRIVALLMVLRAFPARFEPDAVRARAIAEVSEGRYDLMIRYNRGMSIPATAFYRDGDLHVAFFGPLGRVRAVLRVADGLVSVQGRTAEFVALDALPVWLDGTGMDPSTTVDLGVGRVPETAVWGTGPPFEATQGRMVFTVDREGVLQEIRGAGVTFRRHGEGWRGRLGGEQLEIDVREHRVGPTPAGVFAIGQHEPLYAL